MGIQLAWHGHSCFIVACSGYSIAVDPYADYVPGYAPLHLSANEVLCSHEHPDHACVEAVHLIPGGKNPFAVTGIEVPHDDQNGAARGMNVIRIFACEGLRIAHFGDIGCMPNQAAMEQLQNLDAALIPVGGFYTIDASQARKLVNDIGCRVTIPMHYRLGQLGFEAIGPMEDFTSLCDDVVYYDSNEMTIERNMEKQTAVLKYMG
jgi:L-ascorbate metabolism protein UlaG (beta-lactamase superfamily)